MLTINDLLDQFDIQGYVVIKNINPNGDVEVIVGGDVRCLPESSPYRNRGIAYMYAENDELVIEIKEEE